MKEAEHKDNSFQFTCSTAEEAISFAKDFHSL